jgi:gliding motility-associated lipoprotein GldD
MVPGLGLMVSTGCREAVSIPKPHAFPRIEFPVGKSRMVDEAYCPLRFEFPDYGRIVQDTGFFDEKPLDPCWFTIEISPLNASLHCSYGRILNKSDFDKYIADEFKLLGKHNIKADFRDEVELKNKQGVGGMAFLLEGPVATPYQFFLTDSTRHFFRASLYFNAQVNPDSTRPVLEFLMKDLRNMQETFAWK